MEYIKRRGKKSMFYVYDHFGRVGKCSGIGITVHDTIFSGFLTITLYMWEAY